MNANKSSQHDTSRRGEADPAKEPGPHEGTPASRPEPPRRQRRTATEMAPGIPTGSGEGIDRALQQPDSDLGGGVAGDTTIGPETKKKRGRDVVERDDKDRTTL